MIWFHKILKLVFQKQSSYPPIFTAFLEILLYLLYLKKNDSVEHV